MIGTISGHAALLTLGLGLTALRAVRTVVVRAVALLADRLVLFDVLVSYDGQDPAARQPPDAM